MRAVNSDPGAGTRQTMNASGSYVLVVDDNSTICHLFAEALRQASLEVEEAKDGIAAMALIQERTPAVIVTDRDMPGLDGLALVRWVRARPCTKQVPIVLVSAGANSPDCAAEAWESGCDAVLQKPCSVRELQLIVCAAARRLQTPVT